MLRLESAHIPRARHARECLIADRRIICEKVSKQRYLRILDLLLCITDDVERHIECLLLSECTERHRIGHLSARIDIRCFFRRFFHRLHGLRDGTLPYDLDSVEIVGVHRRILRRKCRHRQCCDSRSCESDPDTALQLLRFVLH